MDSEDDDSDYRSAVLTGRGQALSEMSALVSRLSIKAALIDSHEAKQEVFVSNWLEVVAWLKQAESEACDELALL